MENKFVIELDCSPRLETVLKSIAESLAGVMKPAPKRTTRKADKAPEVKNENEEDARATEAKTVVAETKDEVKVETEEPVKEDVQGDPKPADHSAPSADDKEITDADIRAAIRDCRVRNMGGDENSDPILRKAITEAVKAQITKMGYQHSTMIPQEERPAFIEFCKVFVLTDPNNKDQPF